MKKTISFLLILILCLSLLTTVSAAGIEAQLTNTAKGSMGVMWVNADRVILSLTFSGNTCYCDTSIYGKSGTTSITATLVLSRKNSNGTYTTLKTWGGLYASGSMLIFSDTYYVATDNIYRLTVTTTVYRDGTGETVTRYVEAYAF